MVLRQDDANEERPEVGLEIDGVEELGAHSERKRETEEDEKLAVTSAREQPSQ